MVVCMLLGIYILFFVEIILFFFDDYRSFYLVEEVGAPLGKEKGRVYTLGKEKGRLKAR
jgi:hypothetical protein